MKLAKILVIDNSLLLREFVLPALAAEIEVVGVAHSLRLPHEKIARTRPDVLVVNADISSPVDVLDFVRFTKDQNLPPVLAVSFLARKSGAYACALIETGAAGVVTKLDAGSFSAMVNELCEKVKAIAFQKLKKWQVRQEVLSVQKPFRVVGIGASAGGVEALQYILERLPALMPGVVVAQHGPPGLASRMAESLSKVCAMEVKEARSGDWIVPGRVLIAPCDQNLEVRRGGNHHYVVCKPAETDGYRPSIDALFASMANSVGSHAIGIVLSGIGYDGAQGLLAMRHAGALTFAQDKATSAVFGMPKAAYECGGAKYLVPLDVIPVVLSNLVKARKGKEKEGAW